MDKGFFFSQRLSTRSIDKVFSHDDRYGKSINPKTLECNQSKREQTAPSNRLRAHQKYYVVVQRMSIPDFVQTEHPSIAALTSHILVSSKRTDRKPLSLEVDDFDHLVLLALGQARINGLDKVGRQSLAKLINVGAVNVIDFAERDVDNLLVLEEEVLGDLGGAWIGIVECGDEGSGLAFVVELVVDGSIACDVSLSIGL